MQNIILFGPMGAGKGTVASILAKEYMYTIKSLGYKIHHETRLHGSESREEMQEYGQAMRKIFGPDVWNNYLYNQMYGGYSPPLAGGRFVIDDGRQLNEYDYWKSKGFITLGVIADEVTRDYRLKLRNGTPTPPERFQHATELQAIECFNKCDYQITNNGGLGNLSRKVKVVIDAIG